MRELCFDIEKKTFKGNMKNVIDVENALKIDNYLKKKDKNTQNNIISAHNLQIIVG